MKLMMTLVLGLTVFASSARGEMTGAELNRRMDCRFHGVNGQSVKFCYASALYLASFQRDRFQYDGVRFGVGCDRQTIFDDIGIIFPRDILGEKLRPHSTTVPQIELEEAGALARTGSYAAKLELSSGELFRGYCYVTDVSEKGDQPGLTDPIRE